MAKDKFIRPTKATTKEIVNISQIRQCWLDNNEQSIRISYGGDSKVVTFFNANDCRDFFNFLLTELKVTEI